MSKSTTATQRRTDAASRIARHRLSVSLPADLIVQLLEQARTEDRNTSSMVAAALRHYFQR